MFRQTKCNSLNVLDKVQSDHSYMVVYSCKKCGELNYLTPHAFWNISDLGIKCKNCGTINTVTLENGELRKQS
jgi:DNA-directed RNA polymerase subunit RPC12/RpoP